MYNFKALECFLAVAELGSFKLAAGQLNRSQSAVSVQVRQLEEQLGLPLFHRTTRMVRLTRQGEQLCAYVQRALREIDTGLNEIRKAASADTGVLAIASVPSIAGSVLPQLLRDYKAKHPNISLSLRELHADDLLIALQELAVDFGIGPEVPGHPELCFTPLVSEKIVAVSALDLGLPHRDSLTLAQVVTKPLILISSGAYMRRYIDAALAEQNLTAEESFEVTNVRTMLDFAQAGLGTALIPAASVPSPPPKGVQVASVRAPALQRTICRIELRGTAMTPFAREMASRIAKVLAEDPRFHKIPAAD